MALVDIGNGAQQLVASTVLITINDIQGYFITGDVIEAAATLLHELGHGGQGRVWGLGHENGFPAQLVLTDENR
jgi:hypothetical protein